MARSSDRDWVDRLVRALAQVHEVEGECLEELAERRWQRERSERDFLSRFQMSDPARDLQSFYHHACYSEGRYFEERYARLRAALHDAAHILGQHPALTAVAQARKNGHEFLVRIFGGTHGNSRISMVAGLMCRAQQVGKDGFSVASRELKSLLDLSLEEGFGSIPNDLAMGYHVSLFYGLQLSEGVEIADDVIAVPLKQTSAFLNRDVLQNVAPGIASGNRWKAVGAILNPVPWKPILLSLGDESVPQLDWGGSFSEDAQALIEILSVSHGEPIVSLMDIPYCIDRTASLLLGQPHYHSSTSWKSWAQAFGGLTKSHQLDIDALDQAKQVFLDRGRYQEFASIVSRLSEALARTGQYAADDKILDVAIALEQMYELDRGEISFKLKIRAACFLKSDTQARERVFKDVGDLYDARSGIVHRRTKQLSAETKRDAFNKGFGVARRSVVKLLREGSPPDWNKVVMAGTESE